MKEKDYVIFKTDTKGSDDDNKKPIMNIGKVTKVTDKHLNVLLEKDVHVKKKIIEVSKKNVVLNVGDKPYPGKAYGIDLGCLHLKTFEHDFWGNIHFFTRLDKKVLKMLQNSLDRTAKTVEKLRLTDYTNVFETQIRAKQGKWAGKFLFKKDGNHMVWYSPEWSPTPESMDYVIMHEFGHVIRYTGLTSKKVRANWLKLYHQTVAPQVIKHSVLKGLKSDLRAMSSEEMSFKQALRALTHGEGEDDPGFDTEERLHQFKILMRWFKQIHHLTPNDLGTIWDADNFDQIESLWPTMSIDSSKLKPLVSEYATVNVEELFAESFAFYSQKKKLPKAVESYLEKSLSIIRDTTPTVYDESEKDTDDDED